MPNNKNILSNQPMRCQTTRIFSPTGQSDANQQKYYLQTAKGKPNTRIFSPTGQWDARRREHTVATITANGMPNNKNILSNRPMGTHRGDDDGAGIAAERGL